MRTNKAAGSFMKRARMQHRKTVREISSELGVSINAIYLWEYGRSVLSQERVLEVARAYQMTHEETVEFTKLHIHKSLQELLLTSLNGGLSKIAPLNSESAEILLTKSDIVFLGKMVAELDSLSLGFAFQLLASRKRGKSKN